MGADAGPGVEEPVANARNLGVEIRDHLRDGVTMRLDPTGRAREQGDQGPRQVDVGHAQSTTAASTDQIAGRLSATIDHVLPSSRLPYSWPVLVPK